MQFCVSYHRQQLVREGDGIVDIRFISSLTPEDEDAFASAILKGVMAMLDQFPIAYTLRIETTTSRVFQHTSPSVDLALTPGRRPRVPVSVRTD